MTNHEYIIGFQNNDQRVITTFYEKFEKNFKRNLISKHSIHDEDLLADIYQETIIRLWENIQRGRIAQENLTADIAGYLYGIGKNVLREQFRKMKEQSLEDFPQLPEDATDYVLESKIQRMLQTWHYPLKTVPIKCSNTSLVPPA
ncbi:MAG: sigma-70 family RNA polymerase sigma factor [Peptococcaceae bacterium]|nr:sigma-70 family RNA polymerase sigma factor [Peptococcaceae bacterium]